ncbi:MAG TPA: hypothetical protein V6D43_11005 [Candidatus Sericytochromatia bacterium]
MHFYYHPITPPRREAVRGFGQNMGDVWSKPCPAWRSEIDAVMRSPLLKRLLA